MLDIKRQILFVLLLIAFQLDYLLNDDGTGLNISGSGGTNPPESGSIGIFISYLTSSILDFDKAYYDLEIASGSGINTKVTRILEGQVQVSKNITTGSF